MVSILTAQVERLTQAKAEIEAKYHQVNERDKAMRHKAGQTFLDALRDVGMNKPSLAKTKPVVSIEDEEAINRMMKQIAVDGQGDFARRLKGVAHEGLDLIAVD